MTYKLGIDVGSTTLKAVVLNDQDEIVYKSYERHKSKVREMSVSKLKELHELLQGQRIALAITGSAGLGIPERLSLRWQPCWMSIWKRWISCPCSIPRCIRLHHAAVYSQKAMCSR